MNWKHVGIVLMVVGLVAVVGGYHLHQTNQNTNYQYEVKSEQAVNANATATQYENLSPEMQDALFHAFKKSDHFLGGSSAYIETDERLDIDENWQLVEVKGVQLLVGVELDDTTQYSANYAGGVGFFSILAGAVALIVGIFTYIENR